MDGLFATLLASEHMGQGTLRGLFRYGESEIDPVIQAEILTESARNEARIAILEILLALGFGAVLGLTHVAFRAVALFCFLTVLPLLVDAALRRQAAARLREFGPPGLR